MPAAFAVGSPAVAMVSESHLRDRVREVRDEQFLDDTFSEHGRDEKHRAAPYFKINNADGQTLIPLDVNLIADLRLNIGALDSQSAPDCVDVSLYGLDKLYRY